MTSFYSEDLTSSAGMATPGLYRISHAVFQKYDYAGKSPTMANVLRLQLIDSEGFMVDRYYSTGMAEPNADGSGLTTSASLNSNFGILMSALGDAGFPKETLKAGDIRALIGLDASWEFKEVDRGVGMQVSQVFVPTFIYVSAPPAPEPAPPPMPMAPPPMPMAPPQR